jgi:hypothetical protein
LLVTLALTALLTVLVILALTAALRIWVAKPARVALCCFRSSWFRFSPRS